MTVTQIVFGNVPEDPDITPAPAMSVRGVFCTTFTPSGSNQQTTVSAQPFENRRCVARIATDTQVYVSFGPNPNALTDDRRFLIPAGTIEYLYVNANDKAAVVTG